MSKRSVKKLKGNRHGSLDEKEKSVKVWGFKKMALDRKSK